MKIIFIKIIPTLAIMVTFFYLIRAFSFFAIDNHTERLNISVNYLSQKEDYVEFQRNYIDYHTEVSYITKLYIQENYNTDSWLYNPFYRNSESSFGILSLIQAQYNPDYNSIVYRNPYWLGTSDILRIMMLYFDYETLVRVNLSISILTILIFIYLFQLRMKKTSLTILVVLALLLSDVLGGLLIFHTANVINIALLGSIIILWTPNFNRSKLLILFAFLGGLTAYLDWFSTPAITLLMPLMILLLKLESEPLRIKLNYVFEKSTVWLLSYFLTVTIHWLIVGVFSESNTLIEGISRLINNTALDESGFTVFFTRIVQAVLYNVYYLFPFRFLEKDYLISSYDNIMLIIFSAIIITSYSIYLFAFRKITTKKMIIESIDIIIVSIAPFLWLILFSGHSVNHSFFTFRILLVSVIGLSALILRISNATKKIPSTVN
jgi:hypothetical protein